MNVIKIKKNSVNMNMNMNMNMNLTTIHQKILEKYPISLDMILSKINGVPINISMNAIIIK